MPGVICCANNKLCGLSSFFTHNFDPDGVQSKSILRYGRAVKKLVKVQLPVMRHAFDSAVGADMAAQHEAEGALARGVKLNLADVAIGGLPTRLCRLNDWSTPRQIQLNASQLHVSTDSSFVSS